ncbi:MAG TPA: DUF488 family protein [Acidimicrobiia bacterium]|nr:DUF488 family protein [Acidimicrobiia bacterium]
MRSRNSAKRVSSPGTGSGVPAVLVLEVDRGDAGRRRMRERLEGESADALARLVDRARGRRIAVLCLEHDQSRCHRHVILEMIRTAAPDLETLPLL